MIQFCYWQKKQSWKVEQKNAAIKEGTVHLRYVSGMLPQIIGKITSFPNSFHGQGRRKDEAIALSWFWPKIDFSEEKCLGKCLKEHFWASRIKIFLGSMPPDPPPCGSRLQRSKLASYCSEVWRRPWRFEGSVQFDSNCVFFSFPALNNLVIIHQFSWCFTVEILLHLTQV